MKPIYAVLAYAAVAVAIVAAGAIIFPAKSAPYPRPKPAPTIEQNLSDITANWKATAANCYQGGVIVGHMQVDGNADTPKAQHLIARMRAACFVDVKHR